jgi:hypothetical protein
LQPIDEVIHDLALLSFEKKIPPFALSSCPTRNILRRPLNLFIFPDLFSFL